MFALVCALIMAHYANYNSTQQKLTTNSHDLTLTSSLHV